jgi:hypothetical protein
MRGQSKANRQAQASLPGQAVAWAAALAAPLAGCGIGLSLGVNVGDQPPAVSIAASADFGAPGSVIQLVAAASDDFGVDSVAFYRIEADGSLTLLATDFSEPYQTAATLIGAVGGRVSFVARATDSAGQRSESAPVQVALR